MIFFVDFDILTIPINIIAKAIKENNQMISRNVTIKNSVGLHARPATFFIQKANSYKSTIWVEKSDCRVNAKSLLGVLSLGIEKGTGIVLIADGSDEREAIAGLADLIENGLGTNPVAEG